MAVRLDEVMDSERFAYDVLMHQLPLLRFPENQLQLIFPNRPPNIYRWHNNQIPITCRSVTVMCLRARDGARAGFQTEFEKAKLDTVDKLVNLYITHYKSHQLENSQNWSIESYWINRTVISLAAIVELAMFLGSKNLFCMVNYLPKIWADVYEEHLKKKLEEKDGGLNALKRFGDVKCGIDEALNDFIRCRAFNYENNESEFFRKETPALQQNIKIDWTDTLVTNDEFVFLDMKRDIEQRRERQEAGIDSDGDD